MYTVLPVQTPESPTQFEFQLGLMCKDSRHACSDSILRLAPPPTAAPPAETATAPTAKISSASVKPTSPSTSRPLEILCSFGSPGTSAVIPVQSRLLVGEAGLRAGFWPRPVVAVALFPALVGPAVDVAVPVAKDIVSAQISGLGALLGSGLPGARGTLFARSLAGCLAWFRPRRRTALTLLGALRRLAAWPLVSARLPIRRAVGARALAAGQPLAALGWPGGMGVDAVPAPANQRAG